MILAIRRYDSGLNEHVFIEFNGFVQGHNFLLTRASDPSDDANRQSLTNLID
jgi:hypothetical protein